MKGNKVRIIFIVLSTIFLSATLYARILDVTDYGIVDDGQTDNTQAINDLFSNEVREGDTVYFPKKDKGIYKYSGNLILRNKTNVTIEGDGMYLSKLKTTNREYSAFKIVNCHHVTVRDIQVWNEVSVDRSALKNRCGFYVKGEGDIYNEDQIHFNRVKVRNTENAGIFFDGVDHGSVKDSEVIETRPDGIHVTNNGSIISKAIEIFDNYAYKTGDDSYSTVGYNGYQNEYIGIIGNESWDSNTSGVTVEGSRYVEVVGNKITRSGSAGIRVASEISWPTSGVYEVTIEGNILDEIRMNKYENHPVILVYTNNETVQNVNITNNNINDPQTWMVFQLYGANASVVNPTVTYNTIDEDSPVVLQCVNMGDNVQGENISSNIITGANPRDCDCTKSWLPSSRITWNTGNETFVDIAATSLENIYLIYESDSTGNYEIYFKKSTDGGIGWSELKRLTWNSGDSRNPVLSAVQANPYDKLYIAWTDDLHGNYEIYYKKSEDSGETWSAIERLTWNSGDSVNPDIHSNSNNEVQIVWQDDKSGNKEIYFKYSSDGGATWAPYSQLTWNAGFSRFPVVTENLNDKVHVFWDDNSQGDYAIYYNRSTDGGVSWSGSMNITDINNSTSPYVASDPNNHYLQLVWSKNNTFHMKSTNDGVNWSSPINISGFGNSYRPTISIGSDSQLHVVWYDSFDSEIYYSESTSLGDSWGSSERLTWTSGYSIDPKIAVNPISNLINIVWIDNSAGNFEIYFKRGI